MSIQGKTFREVKICCQFVARSGCIRMHLPAFALRDTPPPYSQGIPTIKAICGKSLEAAVGFEPTNNGFANRRLRPLGYAAISKRPGW